MLRNPIGPAWSFLHQLFSSLSYCESGDGVCAARVFLCAGVCNGRVLDSSWNLHLRGNTPSSLIHGVWTKDMNVLKAPPMRSECCCWGCVYMQQLHMLCLVWDRSAVLLCVLGVHDMWITAPLFCVLLMMSPAFQISAPQRDLSGWCALPPSLRSRRSKLSHRHTTMQQLLHFKLQKIFMLFSKAL